MRKAIIAVGLAALAGCGGVSKEQYGSKEAEAAKYQQALQDETGKVAALEQKNAALEAQVADLSKQLAATAASKSELELATAKLSQQSIELQGKQATRLADRLLFKEGSAVLTAEAKRSLDTIADAIAQLKDKSVIVAAYTDDREGGGKGATAARWQLSSARALAVAKYLAGRGVAPRMIGVAGFGEARPVAPNDTIANRAQNRRVEIALTPAVLELRTIEVAPATLK